MNSKLLVVTRAALAFATVVSDFIIRNSAKITAAAVVIHAWTLKATASAAYAKADKAFDTADALRTAHVRASLAAWALDRTASNVGTAARAELALIGA